MLHDGWPSCHWVEELKQGETEEGSGGWVVEKGNDRGGKISQVKSSIDKVKVGLTHATAVLLDSYPSDVWDATTLGEQFFFQNQSGPATPL